ncbi:centrosomal protein 20 [Patella vulgata]|uniref:centrosomal protein 20 n=1 Tax=Patella vulgata TaxID=6465 RepID=UPI00217F6CB2|nr:centrosomal protein 20 [Patella vulgata]
MASTDELKEVLKESLENRGVLGQIKARIRAEVFTALNDQTENKPQLSNENVLINELIREYLEYNNYKYAASVLVSESGMHPSPLDRDFLKNELNIVEDGPSRSVPLMYSLISTYSNQHRPKNKQTGAGKQSKTAFLEHIEKDLGPGVSEGDPVFVKSGRL